MGYSSFLSEFFIICALCMGPIDAVLFVFAPAKNSIFDTISIFWKNNLGKDGSLDDEQPLISLGLGRGGQL